MRARSSLVIAGLLLVVAALGPSCASTTERAPAPTAPAPPPAPSPRARPSVLALERIHADPPLAGRTPMSVTFSPDGRLLAFLKGSEADASVLDLWAIDLVGNGDEAPRPDPYPLVRTSDLVTGEVALSEEEKMALERKRVRETGITSYEWCGESGRSLLFPLDGQLYVTTLDAGGPVTRAITTTKAARLDPTCDPKGRRVSFVVDGELLVVDIESKKEDALTKKPRPEVSFGLAEFVAMEEMGRYRGHWWSGSGRYLAYAEVDEGPVGQKTRSRIKAQGTELYTQRYPAAGEPNAVVKLHVRDLTTKRDVTLALPGPDTYLARAGFVDDDTAFALVQSRDQRTLTLFVADSPGFAPRAVLEETSDTWVELDDDLRFLDDGRVLWKSERPTAMNLLVVAKDGARTALTGGDEPVTGVVAVDETQGLVYFTRATDLGAERHLFVTSTKGGDASVSQARRLTTEPGTHSLTAAKDGAFFVDTWSTLLMPPVTRLLDRSGNVVRVLEAGGSDDWRGQALPRVERFTVDASDGTKLPAVLLHPVGALPGERAPVLHYVYGGPHASVTQDRWGRLVPFFVRLTQRGYAVFLVDNRGSEGRDEKFRHAIFHRMGDIEVEDQLAAVRALAARPDVDGARVAVFGWSYGGYLTARLMLDEACPYAGGIAVAPVTDWALYDTHYTERYLGTPQGAPDVYGKAALPGRAALLERDLLVMHGLADDNVLFDHTLALLDALVAAKRPVELMAYPGKAHGIGGREAQIHVFTMLERFLARTAGPGLHERGE